MRGFFAVVLLSTCALGFPQSSRLAPIEPKATAPACTTQLTASDTYTQVSVPAGGCVSISDIGTRRRLVVTPKALVPCGWIFTSTDGSKLSMTCSTFNLATGEDFLVTERLESTNRYTYTGRTGPSNTNYASSRLAVAFRYNQPSSTGVFNCNVCSRSTVGTTAAVTTTTTKAPTTTTTTKAPTTTTKPATNSTASATSTCRCGIANRGISRIVGGVATEVNEYPWQVGLIAPAQAGTQRQVFCGGTLICDRYIITAAHCVTGETTSSFDVMLGAHSTLNDAASAIIRDPIKITMHPSYGTPSMDNDLAIIEIKPLNFSDPAVQVRPVCLPDSNTTYVGTNATVSGWGTLTSGGDQPAALREVTIPVVSNTDCRAVYGTTITSNMLCAGTAEGNKDSCQGDSGGPLIAPDGANYELIGVVSFGAGCGDPGVPGVYARVTAYQDWIAKNTPGCNTCPR